MDEEDSSHKSSTRFQDWNIKVKYGFQVLQKIYQWSRFDEFSPENQTTEEVLVIGKD